MLYSAGIIPFRFNKDGEMEFFLGHPGGNHWRNRHLWMFLKGCVSGDESWQETALREFKEESKAKLPEDAISKLIPLGSVLQNTHKTTIAFGIEFGDINPEECSSNMAEDGSCYEIDAYEWMNFDKVKEVTHPTHIGFYEQLISMFNENY